MLKRIVNFKKTILFFLVIFSFLINFSAYASTEAPFEVGAKSYVLMDYKTGKILLSKNKDKKLAPASLTKVMTAYIVFKELSTGNIKLTDKVRISKKAWKMQGSKMFIREGEYVTVEDLIKGMVVQSGNDSATALAEYISGSVDNFSFLMNSTAKKIGMKKTNFKNPTGMPSEDHYTTASDLSLLSKKIIEDFPEYYYIYQLKQFTYSNITQKNRNKLLNEGFDGLKTGYTKSAGYCYIGTQERDGKRFIVVIMGSESADKRFEEAKTLINYSFRNYENYEIFESNKGIKELTTSVVKGEMNNLYVGVKEDLILTLKKEDKENIVYKVNIVEKVIAPIKENTVVGRVRIELNGKILKEVDLVALNEVKKGSWIKQIKDSIIDF